MVEYLKQMSAIVSDSTEEEAEAAIGAIAQEVKGKELLVATDQKLSKVLEKLIESNASRQFVIKPIFRQLNSVVLDLVYDQYGSHVFETLLRALPETGMDRELEEVVTNFTESVCSDVGGIMSDVRSTFVLRAAALAFSGFTKPEGDDIVVGISKMEPRADISPGLVKCFDAIMTGLVSLSSDEIGNIAAEVHSSVTLQLLLALQAKMNYSLCESLMKRILRKAGSRELDEEFLSSSLDDRVKSKLLEAMVCILNAKESKLSVHLVDRFIAQTGDVLAMVDGDSTPILQGTRSIFDLKYSFGFLQVFVSSLKNEAVFTSLVSSLLTVEKIRECVKKGRGNGIALIQRFAEKAVIFIDSQKIFVQNLTAAIGINSKSASAVWVRLLTMNVDSFDDSLECETEIMIDESKITPQGCLLLSTLMAFKQQPIQILISNTALLVDHLKDAQIEQSKFFTEVGPGRTLQTIMSSTCALPTGIKKKIIKAVILSRTTEQLAILATDRKVGSWMITTIWDSCTGDVQLKQELGESLLKIEGIRELNWKVWKHCELATFTRRNDQWTATEKRKAKVQNVFKDIIGTDTKKVRK